MHVRTYVCIMHVCVWVVCVEKNYSWITDATRTDIHTGAHSTFPVQQKQQTTRKGGNIRVSLSSERKKKPMACFSGTTAPSLLHYPRLCGKKFSLSLSQIMASIAWLFNPNLFCCIEYLLYGWRGTLVSPCVSVLMLLLKNVSSLFLVDRNAEFYLPVKL